MQSRTTTVYTTFSNRLWAAAFDLTFSIIIGMLAAVPCGIWYNSSHPENSSGSGSGISLWALVIIVLLSPLVAQATLATSPGSIVTQSRTRIFSYSLKPVRWYRGLLHAAIFPLAVAATYFGAGAWPAVALVVVGYVISPLIDGKHRTLNEWLSHTLVLSEADAHQALPDKSKAKPTLDVEVSPFSKAQRLAYAISMAVLIAGAIAASFIIAR